MIPARRQSGHGQVDQRLAVARQRLVGSVGDLAGESESARRIAVWTRVALDENPMKDGVLGIIDPVLVGDGPCVRCPGAHSEPTRGEATGPLGGTSGGASLPIIRTSTGSGMVATSWR